MAKLPDSFWDELEAEEATTPLVKIPKGWNAAEADDEDTDDDENIDIVLHDAELEDPADYDTDENTVPEAPEAAPEPELANDDVAYPETLEKRLPRLTKRSWVEDWDKDDVPAVVAKPQPKKRNAYVEDFEDDEVETPLVKRAKQQWAVEAEERKTMVIHTHYEDEDTGEVFSETIGGNPVQEEAPKGHNRGIIRGTEPVVNFDDDEDEAPAPYKAPAPKEVIVPVKPLSERALLVSMNISQWSGRRFDRAISEEVNAAKAAGSNAGRFNKMLLPDCAELAEVHRQTSSLRNWFVEKTMPWMNDGARITPAATYLDFTSEFRRRKSEWEKAVDALVDAYPTLRVKAMQSLGSMYRSDDYPHRIELRGKFAMSIRAFPLPDKNDFRVDLDPKTMAALKESMADVEGDLARQVVGECYQRLGKAVGAMAERLGDPDAVFRNSLTENLAEAVSALKDLNICGDPELEKLRRKVESTLTGYTADELRNSAVTRKTAADSAKRAVEEINKRMAGLY